MASKFTLTKEVEYKHGQVDVWYMVRLENEDGTRQIIDLVKDDEEKAHQMLEAAVEKWIPPSKSVIKEVVVEA